MTRAKDGSVETVFKAEAFPLLPGDALVVETGGGGGYGRPELRTSLDIERDLHLGYITDQAARNDYNYSPGSVLGRAQDQLTHKE